jgi:hypothetical protein
MERALFRDYFTDLEAKILAAPDPALTKAVRVAVEKASAERSALAIDVVSVDCGSTICRVQLRNAQAGPGNAERALAVLGPAQRAAGLVEATVYAHPEELVSVAFVAKSHELPDVNTHERYEKLFGGPKRL